MLSRIIPLLSLVVLIGLVGYLWSNGTLGHVLRPAVVTFVAKTDIRDGQQIAPATVTLQEKPVRSIPSGAFFFPKGTKLEEAIRSVGPSEFKTPMKRGAIITGNGIRETRRLYGLRTARPVTSGEAVDFSSVGTYQINTDAKTGAFIFDPGAVVFGDIAKSQTFLSEGNSIRFGQNLAAGVAITASDLATDEATVFVVRSARSARRGMRLDAENFFADEMAVDDVDDGVAVFRDQGSAEKFAAGLSNFEAAMNISNGRSISAGALAPLPPEERSVAANPRTLDELEAYQAANPGEVLRFDNIGPALRQEGAPADIWVEVRRTSGDLFGQIDLRRIAMDVPMRRVDEITFRSPGGEAMAWEEWQEIEREMQRTALANGEIEAQGIDMDLLEEEIQEHYWMKMPEKVKQTISRVDDSEGLVFILSSDINIAELIGNGVVCHENSCSVNRSASNDLEGLREISGAIGAGVSH